MFIEDSKIDRWDEREMLGILKKTSILNWLFVDSSSNELV